MNRIPLLNKQFFIVLFVFLFSQMNAQKIEKYFDYKWRECKPNIARFHSYVIKTDSGYCRKDYYIRERKLQMLGNYKDSLLQIKFGKFHYFHANGSPRTFGKYMNNKKEGLWLGYYDNKVKSDSAVYIHGNQIGKRLSWYPNGRLCDSVFTNINGSGIAISRFDNGTLSSTGQFSAEHKKDGIWNYYHLNGKISSIEIYHDSKLMVKQYYDENGIQSTDTTSHDSYPLFPGGEKVWIKYLDKQIYFPPEYEIINGDVAVVIVKFTINENGMIENVFTSTSFDKNFDKIAENAIKKSPKWIPGIEHNRRVKCTYTQPVTFKGLGEWY